MNFDEYQSKARETAIYPNKGNNLVYPILGLNGEAGEVAEKLKKLIRDEHYADADFVKSIDKELGDVLWYIAAICSELGISMNGVAHRNIRKLEDRKVRNVLSGSGDNR
ncbi:hypothetical protein AC477_00115 [miscellaneous Crenarchaeota group-1 archaeon SG8-32-1]|uniref:NTP pyrophosphohydrolase MazG-like domain-containing protein n=1 Tax=miscellaneous Crenarchaeota group-1 archaeon SG8-32-1 TaxID=1685124 RepID=A0A0M0C1T3_9ARCH|nr:MAG: hypothetical protein AC477_00115 [miscellaneous Crenarchaeota group-1 archaeon SG8-32-1]